MKKKGCILVDRLWKYLIALLTYIYYRGCTYCGQLVFLEKVSLLQLLATLEMATIGATPAVFFLKSAKLGTDCTVQSLS